MLTLDEDAIRQGRSPQLYHIVEEIHEGFMTCKPAIVNKLK